MGELGYDEFELVLEGTSSEMTVRVAASPVGPTAPVPFTLPGIDDQSLKILVLTMRAVRGVRAVEQDVSPDIKKYGEALFHALFHDDSLSALRGSLHVSSAAGRGLRLRIRSAGDAIANVPWELLYDPERRRFPCQYAKYPITRYLETAEMPRPLRIDGPIRMLVVISSPTDLYELDTDAEFRRLQTAVEPLISSGRLQVDRLTIASLEVLRQRLLEREYHIFHYIGHGGVDAVTGDGILALTDKYGRLRNETGHDLGVILSNSPIRLAVLNSCEGARISEVDPYAGTAASLVNLGIPAVVAMQFEITDQAAIAFSGAMYLAMTAGQPIDLAVTLARQAILTTSRSEWATPVLYLGSATGELFDLNRPTTSIEVLAAVPEPAAGLSVSVAGPSVELTWGQVEGSDPKRDVSWEVYRDGDLVAETEAHTVTDRPPAGTHNYAVVAVSSDGRRSRPSDLVEATIAPLDVPPPDQIHAKKHRRAVTLEWQQPDGEQCPIDHWELLVPGRQPVNVTTRKATIPIAAETAVSVVAVASDGRPSLPTTVRVRPGSPRGWVIAGAAALLVGGGAFWAVSRGPSPPPPPPPTASWTYRDITTDSAAPPAAASPVLASTAIDGGRPAVYYLSSAGRVQEVRASGASWLTTDLSAAASPRAPNPRSDSPIAATTFNGEPRVYYFDNSGAVQELGAVGTTWTAVSLPSTAPASPGSAIASISIKGSQPRVYYTAGGHIQELRWNGSGWRATDLMKLSGAPEVRPDSTVNATTVNDQPRVYYVTASNKIGELALIGNNWVPATHSEGPDAAPKSPISTITYNQDQPRVYYISDQRHIHELGWDGSKWGSLDISGLAGSPGPVGGTLTATLLSGSPCVDYLNDSGFVQELRWTGSWRSSDLSTGAKAAASNSPITSVAINGAQRRVYVVSSTHLLELG